LCIRFENIKSDVTFKVADSEPACFEKLVKTVTPDGI
jgi:hypothetical protein